MWGVWFIFCVFGLLFLQRFIVPLYGDESVKSDPLLEVRRSIDELRHSMADVVSTINETQTLMRSQQRQIDDVIRSSGLLRVRTHLVSSDFVHISNNYATNMQT